MSVSPQVDDRVDDHVDDEMAVFLDIDRPTSFFLFAGAGSGKTRSLVTALIRIRSKSGDRLRLKGQQIAVITYTNAACDEIKSRMDHDPLFHVSTIHSFVWDLISGFTDDTRKWLTERLNTDIRELEEQERKGRAGTKASLERQQSIDSKRTRLELLPTIRRFTYSPTGDNRGRDALNHSEVLGIGAGLLTNKPLMQSLLVCRFPILLIDESQDTNAALMDAFFAVQAAHRRVFCLGLFGDTMQRIYTDGKKDLGVSLPSDWATPSKKMNHRCPQRVVRLINQIRSAVDTQTQSARSDAQPGHVRLFVCEAGAKDKFAVERTVRDRMATVANDALWRESEAVKTLILEHHMAAKRMGFADLFLPLYRVDSFKMSLLDGSFPPVRLFTEQVLPLVRASRSGNRFAEAAVMRKRSPLLSRITLESAGTNQIAQLHAARMGVTDVMAMLTAKPSTSCLEVLRCVARHSLFEVPEALAPFVRLPVTSPDSGIVDGASQEDQESEESKGLAAFLNAPFSQIEPYAMYVVGKAPLDTHQGVKGLEFPRVLVVMDDEDAGGFLFSFEKLFGAKSKTKNDFENEAAGKETGEARTRRLFYVTCSRSESGLALIAYSSNPEAVRKTVTERGWFEAGEIEMVAA